MLAGDNEISHPSRKLASSNFSPLARSLAHFVAHIGIRPTMYFVDKFGYSDLVWRKIGPKIRTDVIEGSDFGDYQPSSSDVIVCTYPKCGTNWALQIAHSIATRNSGSFNHIHDVVPWPDFTRQDLIVSLEDDAVLRASPTGLRIIKTHLEWERVPYNPNARYICVLRDPKDAFVSSYHFVRDIFFGPVMPTVDLWLRLFCSGGFPFIWTEHVHGYWSMRHLPNLMILTFEEMKTDMPGAIARIADFMEVEMSTQELAVVAERSSFEYMQSIGEKFNPPALTPLASPNRKMIRRGTSGSSSELLSPEQQVQIDEWCRAQLVELGSDLPYDELWARPAAAGIAFESVATTS